MPPMPRTLEFKLPASMPALCVRHTVCLQEAAHESGGSASQSGISKRGWLSDHGFICGSQHITQWQEALERGSQMRRGFPWP